MDTLKQKFDGKRNGKASNELKGTEEQLPVAQREKKKERKKKKRGNLI